jgi:hypothetical protein
MYDPDNSVTTLISGCVDASQMQVFEQTGKDTNTIYRSVDQEVGVAFTWSVWIFISNMNTVGKESQYRHVFSKGNNDMNSQGVVFPNNAPGLYICPHTNAFTIIMNTFDTIDEEILVPDIPLNKWIHTVIRCSGTLLDVYINGVVVRSITLTSVPRQNYGAVYTSLNGGFSGYLSRLVYYNRSLSIAEIRALVKTGPNTTMQGMSNPSTEDGYNYFGLRWYM